MLSFAVIGHPIGHTMSPFIHNRLFELSGKQVDYKTFDIHPDSLCKQYDSTLSKLNGFNITIPHKQAVIPMLKSLDDSAKLYGAVNCVDAAQIGYNTDAFGFCSALDKSGIALAGRVLILGSGGAARTMAFEAVVAGCEVTVAARGESGQQLKSEIEQKLGKAIRVIPFDKVEGGYDLVVNATPVGMYPNTQASPLEFNQLDGCKALFDAVYNPRDTLLIQYARQHGMAVAEGMAMLVWQAVRAHEIWYGAEFNDEDISRLIDDANAEMTRIFNDKSIVLCGFMGCGKSSVGKIIADVTHRNFIDTDLLCEQREGMSIPQMFERVGEIGFRDAEHKACRAAAQMKNAVISTGGGALTFSRNAEVFESSTIVFIDVPFDEVCRRIGKDDNRPLFKDIGKAKALYEARLPLYRQAAHVTVDGVGSAQEVADRILTAVKEREQLCKR